jgi:anti-sigma factor RsiW
MRREQHEHRDMQICRYLDGELRADEVAAFEQHLSEDAALREEVEAYRRTYAYVRAWATSRGRAPQLDWEALARQITTACAMAARRRARWYDPPRLLRLMGPPLAAAAAIAGILAGRELLRNPLPQPVPIARVSIGSSAALHTDGEAVIRFSFVDSTSAPARMAPAPRPARSIAVAAAGAMPEAPRESSSWF